MKRNIFIAPDPLTPCDFCGHIFAHHCKSGVAHLSTQTKMVGSSGIKELRDENGKPRWFTVCSSRHCEGVLCCCIDFVMPKGEKPSAANRKRNVSKGSRRASIPATRFARR